MGNWSALLSGALKRGRIWSRTGSRCSGSPSLLWRMSWHRIHDQPDLTVSWGQERVSGQIKRAAKGRGDYPLLLERDNRRERRRHRGEMWRNALLFQWCTWSRMTHSIQFAPWTTQGQFRNTFHLKRLQCHESHTLILQKCKNKHTQVSRSQR